MCATKVAVERFSNFVDKIHYATVNDLKVSLAMYQELISNPDTPDFLKQDICNRIDMLEKAIQDATEDAEMNCQPPFEPSNAPTLESAQLEPFIEFQARLMYSDKEDLIKEYRIYSEKAEKSEFKAIKQDIARRLAAINSMLLQLDEASRPAVQPRVAR